MRKDCIKEGEKIPEIFVYKCNYVNSRENRGENSCSINLESTPEFSLTTTTNLFKNKRVILIGIPGAFTPVCTSNHIPGYSKLCNKLKKHNIDNIYVFSTNDAYCMNAWIKQMEITNLDFFCDPTFTFTEYLGLNHSIVNKGLFNVCWRFSAVVNDEIIEKLYCEKGITDNPKEDLLNFSNAETMLYYLYKKK